MLRGTRCQKHPGDPEPKKHKSTITQDLTPFPVAERKAKQ